MLRAAPKPSKRVVSRAIQQSARDAVCSLRLDGCLAGTETVVLAHLRLPGLAGAGRKPSDYAAVYACAACHDAIDGRGPGYFTDRDLLRALIETQTAMVDAGLLIIPGAK